MFLELMSLMMRKSQLVFGSAFDFSDDFRLKIIATKDESEIIIKIEESNKTGNMRISKKLRGSIYSWYFPTLNAKTKTTLKQTI